MIINNANPDMKNWSKLPGKWPLFWFSKKVRAKILPLNIEIEDSIKQTRITYNKILSKTPCILTLFFFMISKLLHHEMQILLIITCWKTSPGFKTYFFCRKGSWVRKRVSMDSARNQVQHVFPATMGATTFPTNKSYDWIN